MYKQNAHPGMQNKAKNVNKCKRKMQEITSAQGEQMLQGYSEQKYPVTRPEYLKSAQEETFN